jgi:apolipoprotein D and lipocalin family protein
MRTSTKIQVGIGIATAAVAAFAVIGPLTRHPVGNRNVPEPAKAVDLRRYLGRWFEIARYDQRFERGCEAATADYAMRDDGRIDVVNRCRKRDGRLEEARGIAKIVDDETKAKLKVSFFGPFFGNYWILDHSDDYSWSIVGEPSGRYLWILSRTPNPGDEELRRLVNRTAAIGYDTSMLIFDKHS